MPAGQITTTGTNEDPVTTTFQSGDTIAEWKDKHFDKDPDVAGQDTLTTKWHYNSAGDQKEKSTDRESGEPDSNFKSAHEVAVRREMADCPPVTQYVSGS